MWFQLTPYQARDFGVHCEWCEPVHSAKRVKSTGGSVVFTELQDRAWFCEWKIMGNSSSDWRLLRMDWEMLSVVDMRGSTYTWKKINILQRKNTFFLKWWMMDQLTTELLCSAPPSRLFLPCCVLKIFMLCNLCQNHAFAQVHRNKELFCRQRAQWSGVAYLLGSWFIPWQATSQHFFWLTASFVLAVLCFRTNFCSLHVKSTHVERKWQIYEQNNKNGKNVTELWISINVNCLKCSFLNSIYSPTKKYMKKVWTISALVHP